MVNKAKRLGTQAEVAILDFMNSWYPHVSAEEGYPWSRVTSKGSNDVGDVIGPFTSIEAKNRKFDSLSSMLDNAERKGNVSGLRYWFLVHKPVGVGYANIDMWNAVTTIEALLTRFGVVGKDPEYDTPDKILDSLNDLVSNEVTLECKFVNPAPGREMPPIPWSPVILFSDIRTDFDNRVRERVARDGLARSCPMRLMKIPFVVYPRRDQSGTRYLEEWYARSSLIGFGRTLETLGVLPQDANEYAQID